MIKIWDDLRYFFYQRKLKKQISSHVFERELLNLNGATTIGILYISDSLSADNTILNLKKNLEEKGKKVEILGLWTDIKSKRELPLPYISIKNINWFDVPIIEKADKFAATHFDLLLACFAETNLPLEYIMATSNAKCRVGRYTGNAIECYELMVSKQEDKTLAGHIERMLELLNNINNDAK